MSDKVVLSSLRAERWLKHLDYCMNSGAWDYARGAFRHYLKSENKNLDLLYETVKEPLLKFSNDKFCAPLGKFFEVWRQLLVEEPDAFLPMLGAIGASIRQQVKEGQWVSLQTSLKALESYPDNFKANIAVILGEVVRELAPPLHPHLIPMMDVLCPYPNYHAQAIATAETMHVAITPLDTPQPSHIAVTFKKAGFFVTWAELRISAGGRVNKSIKEMIKIWGVRTPSLPKGNPVAVTTFGCALKEAVYAAEESSRGGYFSDPDFLKKVEQAAGRAERKIDRWLKSYGAQPA